jgi:transcriptional regulator with XRE-family HTH domain
MHARLGVSPALVQLWVTGGVKTPTLDYLERLCIVYNLDFAFVRSLIRKRSRYAAPIGGGSANDEPLPLAKPAEILLLIGHWLARWVRPLHLEWRFA